MRLPKTLKAELDRLFRRREREKRNWQIAEDYENRIAELRADGKSDLTDQAARDVEVNHGLKGEGRQVKRIYREVKQEKLLQALLKAKAKTIVDIDTHQCRWPVGDLSTNFLVCGNDAVPGFSYCVRHLLLSFTPASRLTFPDMYTLKFGVFIKWHFSQGSARCHNGTRFHQGVRNHQTV